MSDLPAGPMRRPTGRDALFALVALAVAIAVSMAGKHLLDHWLSDGPAVLISHGFGLAMLILALRLIVRRSRRAA